MTHVDYSMMNWHDSTIYSMAIVSDDNTFRNEIIFDIDYIHEWKLSSELGSYEVLISPATLRFINVHDFSIDISTGLTTTINLEIEQIIQEKIIKSERSTFKWTIELVNGAITFESEGFEQEDRASPILSKTLRLRDRIAMFKF